MKILGKNDYVKTSPLTVLVYGYSGVGKTFLTRTLPFQKVVYFDFEKKASVLASRLDKDVTFIVPDHWDDIRNSWKDISALIKDAECIVVDSLSAIRDVYLKEKANLVVNGGRELLDRTKSFTFWGYIKEKLEAFIETLKRMGKPIYFIATATETNSSTDAKIVPDLGSTLGLQIPVLMDFVLPLVKNGKDRFLLLVGDAYLIRNADEERLLSEFSDGKMPADLSLIFNNSNNNIKEANNE